MREGAAAAIRAPQQVPHGDRHQQQRLGRKSRQCLHADDLAHQAVERKADRERARDPRRVPRLDREVRHRDGREPHREPLHRVQALAQHEDPEHDIHQGIDVVAQARLHDVPVAHGPHIHQPVAADQQRGQEQAGEQGGTGEDAAEAPELGAQQHPAEDEQARPGDAMRDDLRRRDRRAAGAGRAGTGPRS